MANILPKKPLTIDLDDMDSTLPLDGEFAFPQQNDHEVIYLCGHSLGLQPKAANESVLQVMRQWANKGVKGHFEGIPWMHFQEELDTIMSGLVGASSNEVTIMNTLSVNLHLLLLSFYRPEGRRTKILIEEKAFPSDQYVVQSQLAHHGLDLNHLLTWKRNSDGLLAMEELLEIVNAQGDEIAVALLGGINYYSGQRLPMYNIVNMLHQRHILVGFDLAHAVGNIPMDLHDWGVDFAAWCTYKYLNGGPGSPGAIFVHQKHLDEGRTHLQGWWGNAEESRFEMHAKFDAAEGIKAWRLSTPTILSLAPLQASLQQFKRIGMKKISAKAEKLSDYLFQQLRSLDTRDYFKILTPKDYNDRGAMLSLYFSRGGEEVFTKLSELNIVVDWRRPNVIRVAPMALYNTFDDCYQFVKVVGETLSSIDRNR